MAAEKSENTGRNHIDHILVNRRVRNGFKSVKIRQTCNRSKIREAMNNEAVKKCVEIQMVQARQDSLDVHEKRKEAMGTFEK